MIGTAGSAPTPIPRHAAEAAPPTRDLLVALLVTLAAAVVARLVLAGQLTEDSATYARQILAPGDDFFHPHHLLYNAVVRLLAAPMGALAEGTDPWASVRILQWINLAVTALAPGLMYLIARRLAVPLGLAVGLALAFGLAFRFLTFGSQIEVYNFALVALTLATLGLVLPEDSRAAPWLVAIGYFLAMSFHQTALFFGAAVLILAHGRPQPIRWLLIALVIPGAAIGLAYLGIGLSLGHASPSDLWLWLTAYAHTGSWGKGSTSLETVTGAVRGFSLAWGQGGGEVVVLALLLLAAGLALTTAWRNDPARRRFVVAMACFLLPLALFNAWWYGRNPEFWIMAALPITAALAAMLGAGPSARPGVLRGTLAGLILAQLGLLAWQGMAARGAGVDSTLAEAAAVAHPGDLLLAVDTRTMSYLDLQLLGRDVRLEALSLIALDAGRGGRPIEQALAEAVAERAVQARAAGVQAILDRSILDAPSTARGLENLDRARLRELLGRALDGSPDGARFVPVNPPAG